MDKIIRALSAIMFVGCLGAVAQSMLSIEYPFGLPLNPLSGTAVSMGGVSVGVPDEHHVMLGNPANLGTMSTATFSSLVAFDYVRLRENSNYTDHLTVIPQQVSFVFPLGRAGNLGFSLTRETDAAVRYSTQEQLRVGNYAVRTGYERSGGIVGWQAGWGHSVGKVVSVGATYQRLYFGRTSVGPKDYGDVGIGNERDSTAISMAANGVRVGVMTTAKGISAGAAARYVFESKLRSKEGLYYSDNAGSGDTPVEIPQAGRTLTQEIQLPPELSFGVSYEISPSWLVGTDLGIVLWNWYSPPRQPVLTAIEDDNTVSWSAGFRFIPAPNLLAPEYWETMHYRAGLRYAQLPGNRSSEIAGTFGFGFPLEGNCLIDLAFQAGTRTHQQVDFYSENFLSIALGMSGGRKWHKSSGISY